MSLVFLKSTQDCSQDRVVICSIWQRNVQDMEDLKIELLHVRKFRMSGFKVHLGSSYGRFI